MLQLDNVGFLRVLRIPPPTKNHEEVVKYGHLVGQRCMDYTSVGLVPVSINGSQGHRGERGAEMV